ncbi:glycerophosphodiester phosphodiesterase [soil metagenome]
MVHAARPPRAIDDVRPLRELVNIGHRGASAHAPEHTIAAYDLALAHGAHYIELDVHMTLDRVLVVAHDASIDRTGRLEQGSCSGLIESKSLAELRSLDVGRWFNELHCSRRSSDFVGLRIPTLAEVLARYRHCIKFCIELKSEDPTGVVANELLRVLGQHSLHEPKNGAWRVLLLSFNAASLQRVGAADPHIPLVQVLGEDSTSESIREGLEAIRAYAAGIAPPKAAVDGSLIAAAHERALLVHPYTVNGRSEMAHMLSLGVDGMITDFPDRLDELVWSSFDNEIRLRGATESSSRRLRSSVRRSTGDGPLRTWKRH